MAPEYGNMSYEGILWLDAACCLKRKEMYLVAGNNWRILKSLEKEFQWKNLIAFA